MSEEIKKTYIRMLSHTIHYDCCYNADADNDFEKISDYITNLQKKVEQLENIRKIAIAFVKNNKNKTIAPYGDNEDTDYEVCLFEEDINDLLNILNKGRDKE